MSVAFRHVARAAGVTLLLVAGGACSEEAAPPPAEDAKVDVAADGRVAYLLEKCARNENYDVDTSDPIAILIETLQRGQRDPLRRAREELAALGPDGVRAVKRLVEANLNAQDASANLRNSIDVLTRSDDPGAREPLLRLLTYPEQSIAVLAGESLRKHGLREDFEMVWGLLEVVTPELRSKLLPTLLKLDPVRAQRLYLDWMEGGANEDLWEFVVLDLAAATDPEVVERCRKLWPTMQPRFQFALAAASARGGDEKALTMLRESLRSSNPAVRGLALESLGRADMPRELVDVLRTDGDPNLRARALTFLSAPERVREFMPELRGALGDSNEGVSTGAAVELCKLGDSGAIEHCLQALDDPTAGSIEGALRALREPMASDVKLAGRAFERLRARRDAEAKLPIEARTMVLSAIAQIPIEEAARALFDQARAQRGLIGDMPAARWLVLQAANTGEVGQRVLYAGFASETDPLRRLDLIEGVALRANEFARQSLTEMLESDQLAPYEILYAAERLTRMGPVSLAAPLLKRVTLRVKQPDVRVAMQCLLWSNYPGPR